MTVADNPLVGTWKLVSWETRRTDGEVSYPYGKDAIGCITYTADGYMFVNIMRAGRVPFSAGDILKGTPEEKAGAVEGYFSYSGRYTFEGDRVLHHVTMSLFPNWIGGDQVRNVELNGNRLTLSTMPMLISGSQRTAHLIWEKV